MSCVGVVDGFRESRYSAVCTKNFDEILYRNSFRKYADSKCIKVEAMKM